MNTDADTSVPRQGWLATVGQLQELRRVAENLERRIADIEREYARLRNINRELMKRNGELIKEKQVLLDRLAKVVIPDHKSADEGDRVERLQEITAGDCLAEGIPDRPELDATCARASHLLRHFQKAWDHLNAKRGYSWDSNPWVWTLTFERTETP